MVALKVAPGDVARATAYLGANLDRWQGALREDLAGTSGGVPYVPSEVGPMTERGTIVLRSTWLEAAYAALVTLRARLFRDLRIEDGVRALRALDPILRAIESELDAALPPHRGRRGTT